MTILNVKKLKTIYKAAVLSKKIVYTGVKVQQHHDYEFDNDFVRLSEVDWKSFEEKELNYCKSIASKKFNYGDFRCKGNIKLWISLIKYLSGIFYRNKVFLHKNRVNEPWSVQFIKFCCRIVKSFPRDPEINIDNTTSIEFLERQLYFINEYNRFEL